jgi:hypothetical protein
MAISQLEHFSKEFEAGVDLSHNNKKKTVKGLLNNAGILVGVFIIFVVVIVVTTDIRLATWNDISNLGIDFFLLLFCSYSMYVNCSDSGMRLGLRNDIYIEAVDKFDDKKNAIISHKYHVRLHEFCQHYIQKELENTRMNILAIVGFDYHVYINRWSGLTDREVMEMPGLTKNQKKAIIKANLVEPIRLTPEMIMMRGRRSNKRTPLGITPETKKTITFGVKFITTVITSLFLTAIIVDFVIEPTWLMFVSCVLRLMIVVLNGFSGYKFGYENIVYDTANYMSDQTDLMDQALQYFEENNKVENGV